MAALTHLKSWGEKVIFFSILIMVMEKGSLVLLTVLRHLLISLFAQRGSLKLSALSRQLDGT